MTAAADANTAVIADRPALPARQTVTSMAALELLPVPGVVIARTVEGFRVDLVNSAFRAAALFPEGAGGFGAELDAEIVRFMDSRTARRDLDWQLGHAVDLRYFHLSLARLENRDGPRCLLSLIEHTAQVRTEHSLRREMTTDSLTGLPNRMGFTDMLETAMASEAAHAVLVVDVARFSRINEYLGSLNGDELLISVARRIRTALRACDVLARTGGDEFGLIVATDGGADEPHVVAERIRRVLCTPFRLTSYEIRVDCAVGIALVGPGATDAAEMVRHAQFAAKRAKASGRAEQYQARAFDRARAAFGIETDLRRAIENEQLRLTFQPICDLASGRITSFEALVRWIDDDGRVRLPGEFIPVAEESGLIVPLGRWVIDEATRTLANWDEAAGGDCDVDVAVNLSAIQLGRDTVPLVVARALTGSGLAGARLKLEVTESAFITDPDGIAQTLHALKELGAMIALDDFGTGYSNLAALRKLPIDLLKIDRSFVTGMLVDRDKLAIVRAVLSLSQALGLRTVAEGIETVELAQTLTALGCTYGQGYLYARPLSAADAYTLLVARSA